MGNKGDNKESPQCLKCGELFQEQKSTNKHPDLQEGGGVSGQVLIKGTGLSGQP